MESNTPELLWPESSGIAVAKPGLLSNLPVRKEPVSNTA